MSHKIVQLHQGNDPDWDNIYPITTPEAISDSSGKSLQEMLNEKQDKVFLVTVSNGGTVVDHHYSEIKAAIDAGKEAVCYDTNSNVYFTLWKDFGDNSIVFYGFTGASAGLRVSIGETTSNRSQVNYQTLSNLTKSTDVWDSTSDVKYPSLKAVDGHCAPLSHVSDTGVHVNATEKATWNDKQDKDFIVNVTTVSDGYVADKTYAEILAAYNAGCNCKVRFEGQMYDCVDYSRYDNNSIYFTRVVDNTWKRFKLSSTDRLSYNSDSNQRMWYKVKTTGAWTSSNDFYPSTAAADARFAQLTPSGDPMHYLYVTAGAEYNATGSDITKTAPWGDVVTHKAGMWYLNGLGDLTTEEIRNSYRYSHAFGSCNLCAEAFYLINLRTNFSSFVAGKGRMAYSVNFSSVCQSSNIEVFHVYTDGASVVSFSNLSHAFQNSTSLKHINGTLEVGGVSSLNFTEAFKDTSLLETVFLYHLKVNLAISQSPNLLPKCIHFMLDGSSATTSSPITITLHSAAIEAWEQSEFYDRDIQICTDKGITIASA